MSSSSSRTPIARVSWLSTRPPIARTPLRTASISVSNCLCVCSFIVSLPRRPARAAAVERWSTKSPGNVVLGFLSLRLEEDVVGCAEFDELAEIHVSSEIRHARRLLHVVRDDRDRVVLFELGDELLDL